jgi:hypothetical protein
MMLSIEDRRGLHKLAFIRPDYKSGFAVQIGYARIWEVLAD